MWVRWANLQPSNVKFLQDSVCQKWLKLVHFWRIYSKNKNVIIFWDTVYISMSSSSTDYAQRLDNSDHLNSNRCWRYRKFYSNLRSNLVTTAPKPKHDNIPPKGARERQSIKGSWPLGLSPRWGTKARHLISSSGDLSAIANLLCSINFFDYIDIFQEMLLSLMLFCGKFIKVYVCQKLLKYSLVWQTYGKNTTVQFFCLTVYVKMNGKNYMYSRTDQL